MEFVRMGLVVEMRETVFYYGLNISTTKVFHAFNYETHPNKYHAPLKLPDKGSWTDNNMNALATKKHATKG